MEKNPIINKTKKRPLRKGEGRPTIYSKEIINKTKKYLESCKDKEDEFHKTRGEKSDGYERILRVKLPTIEGLAGYLHVARDTIYQWRREYKEFSDIIEELLQKQADALIANGLSGSYNSTIAKVLLTKHGYREGIEHGGEEGAPIKININNMLEKAYGDSPGKVHKDS